MGPDGRSMAPAAGGRSRRTPKRSSRGIQASSHQTPAPFSSEPAKGEKSFFSGLAKHGIVVQSILPATRKPVCIVGYALVPPPAYAALLTIVTPEMPVPGIAIPPAPFLYK